MSISLQIFLYSVNYHEAGETHDIQEKSDMKLQQADKLLHSKQNPQQSREATDTIEKNICKTIHLTKGWYLEYINS